MIEMIRRGLLGNRIVKAARGLSFAMRLAAIASISLVAACGLDQQIVNSLDPAKDPINPVAVINAPSTTTVRSYVTIDGTQSYSNRNAALKYAWTLTEKPRCSSAGFGTTATTVATDTSCVADATITSTNPSVSFFADKGGYYTVTLSVSEDVSVQSGGSTATQTSTSQLASIRINVVGKGSNHPPVAVFKASSSGSTSTTYTDEFGNPVTVTAAVATLDGTESYDVDGQPLSYSWTIMSDVGSTEAGLRNSTSSISYLYNYLGVTQTFVARLHVSDGVDYDEATLSITF